jgi:hypothetical protein
MRTGAAMARKAGKARRTSGDPPDHAIMGEAACGSGQRSQRYVGRPAAG